MLGLRPRFKLLTHNWQDSAWDQLPGFDIVDWSLATKMVMLTEVEMMLRTFDPQ